MAFIATRSSMYCIGSLLASSIAAGAQAPYTFQHALFSPSAAPQADAWQGYSVAIDDSLAVLGAPYDDIGGEDSGVVKVYDSLNGAFLHLLRNPSPAVQDYFGYSVAVSGNLVVVGAYGDDTAAPTAGIAYVYDLASGAPTQPILTLTKPNPGSDSFGNSVAISGTRVVVGAYRDELGGQMSAGSAYVYELAGATPAVPVLTLTNSTANSADFFGRSVSISGTRVIVGADGVADESGFAIGSAYLYDIASGTPNQPIGVLMNPLPGIVARFGTFVALSDSHAIVGDGRTQHGSGANAYLYDLAAESLSTPVGRLTNPNGTCYSIAISGTRAVAGAYQSGRAYIYDLTAANPLVPSLALTNPVSSAFSTFGHAVAISDARVVVGAFSADAVAVNAGGAYVYDLADASPTALVATLTNASPSTLDFFGYSVSAWGRWVVVGSPLEFASGSVSGTALGTPAGAAYVFDLLSPTPAVPTITLTNPGPSTRGWFAHSVASFDRHVAVGSPYDARGAPDAGIVYVFDLLSSSPTVPALTLTNPAPATSRWFGYALAIDATSLLVGSPIGTGVAYVYRLSGGSPAVPFITFTNPSPSVAHQFGYAVAMSGKHVVVGAPGDDTDKIDAGGTYVFDLLSPLPSRPVARLAAPNAQQYQRAGASLAIFGTRLVVGSPYRESLDVYPSRAHLYDLASASPSLPWITFTNPVPMHDDFGSSVAIFGNHVAVVAPLDDPYNRGAGVAYLYDVAGDRPGVPVAVLRNPDALASNRVFSVALDGITAIIGSPTDDTTAYKKGAAHVFTQAVPDLAVLRSGSNVRISWRLPAPDVVLDRALELHAAETTWSQVPFPYETNATHISVTTNSPADKGFYRLRLKGS